MAQVAPPPRDALVRAHQLYNAHQFDRGDRRGDRGAAQPELADAAAVVLARAHLEHYRLTSDAGDRDAAHDALARVHERHAHAARSHRISRRPRRVALSRRSAALHGRRAVLRAGRSRAPTASRPTMREPIFEWWANALDLPGAVRSSRMRSASRSTTASCARAEDELRAERPRGRRVVLAGGRRARHAATSTAPGARPRPAGFAPATLGARGVRRCAPISIAS